jgi:hypothetical protein
MLLAYIYIKSSRMNEKCRHSSVACVRSDVANSSTYHSNSNIGIAGVAKKIAD